MAIVPSNGSTGGDHLAAFLFDGAAKHPSKVCIEEEDSHLTYGELAELAVIIQKGLRETLRSNNAVTITLDQPPAPHACRPDEFIISVVLERGPLCIAAVHAVMLEGKAYNVFDLGNPIQVLGSQLEVGRPPVVISSAAIAERLNLHSLLNAAKLLDADLLMHERHTHPDRRSMTPLNGTDFAGARHRLAYVIFTSGSTGKPKAVMIEHSSACNQVRVFGERYGLEHADRISQGISMAFDPHVNEVFGALRWGCTLVIMSDALKQSGPDVPPWLIEEHISVLTATPSSYRMMMSPGVDVSRQGLPDLRICGSGGEALKREVLDSWAVGRRFFNLYGPTETTITSVVAELCPGDEIVIGRSLDTYLNVVLDPDTRAPLPRGQHGVLFTGGPGVARGYLNDEAKTRDRFVQLAGVGRAYNTGDVVFQDDAGDFHWVGRADFQVKVRGNRIELENLEHHILEVPGVAHCEARVLGNGQRLALLASGVGVSEAVLKRAASKLGRAYELNVVKIVDAAAWSFSVNGKLLRNTVPLEDEAPQEEAVKESYLDRATSQELASMGYPAILMEVARCLGVALPSVDSDFFSSGGTSVTAAMLVARLRELAKKDGSLRGLEHAAVRDLYECRTMGKFAERLEGKATQRGFTRSFTRTLTPTRTQLLEDPSILGTERYCLVSFLQVLWMFSELALLFMLIEKLLLLWTQLPSTRAASATLGVAVAFGLVPGLILFQTLLVRLVKLLLCWRPCECKIRLWSLHYFRWWAVHHMTEMIPSVFFAGTPFAAWWAWLMGARVGRGVVLWQVPKSADLELVTLGDGVSIGQESYLNTTRAEKGVLHLKAIEIGDGASVGCRANIAGGALVEDGSIVPDLTLVTGHYRSRAADVESSGGGTSSEDNESSSSSSSEGSSDGKSPVRPFGLLIGLAMLPCMNAVLLLYTLIPGTKIAMKIYDTYVNSHVQAWGLWGWVILLLRFFFNAVVAQFSLLLMVVILKWLLVCRLAEGTFRVNSLKYWRFWFMQQLVGFVGAWMPLTLHTVFCPMTLRLLGARIGRATSFGALTHGYTPDLLRVGKGSMLADRCSVGAVRIRAGRCELQRTSLGDRSFVANLAVVPGGSRLADDTLVGCGSLAPVEAEAGSRWLGVPPIELPRRSSPTAASNPPLEMSCLGKTLRFAGDFMRGQLPFILYCFLIFGFDIGPKLAVTEEGYRRIPTLKQEISESAEKNHTTFFWIWFATITPDAAPRGFFFWLVTALWGIACLLVILLTIILLKWLVMCRTRPGLYAFDSYRTRISTFFIPLQTVAMPMLTLTFGTPLICIFYRLLGARIGRRVFMNSLMISEPDIVSLGDGVCLNRMGNLLCHSFDNWMMHFERVTLEEDTVVGCEAVVMPGAAMRQRAVLEDASLCLPDDQLLRGRHRGCPSARVA